jgi:hypothetical protein
MINPFTKDLKDLKLVFLDCETTFDNIELLKKPDWEFQSAKLRLLTWQTWNGEELSEVKTLDTQKHQGDVWSEVKSLILNEDYRLVAYNSAFDTQPDLCGDWILEPMLKGQVLCMMIQEQCLRGFNPQTPAFNIRKVVQNNIEDANAGDDLSDEEDEDTSYRFTLADVANLYLGATLDKTYQDPNNYSFAKEVAPEALLYAEEDVKILFPIFKRQLQLIQEANMAEGVLLKTKLLATGWIYKKYGIPINTQILNNHRVKYSELLEEEKKLLHNHFPKVLPSNGDLIERFLSLGSPKKPKDVLSALEKVDKNCYVISNYLTLHGTTLTKIKKDLMESLKSRGTVHDDLYTAYKSWIQNNRSFLERTPNLGYYADLKQSLRRLGHEVESTDRASLSKLAYGDDIKEIVSLLEYKKTVALLNKVLNRFTHDYYLKSDNTLKPALRTCASINGRVGASSPNILAVPRKLKDILGVPAGFVAMVYDLSAVELQYMLDKYSPPLASKMLEVEDAHLYAYSYYMGENYEKLLEAYRSGCKETKIKRDLSKTTTYFSIYKTNIDKSRKFVTGSNRLIETIRSQLGEVISQETAETLIRNVEGFFSTWTGTKAKVDLLIKKRVSEAVEQIDLSLPFGLKSSFLSKNLYDSEKDYTNGRSIYSSLIAGQITIATQRALNEVQEYLVLNYGADNARLNYYCHDSFSIFIKPEIYKAEKENILKILLENCFIFSGMKNTFLDLAGNSFNDKGQIIDDNCNIIDLEKVPEEKYRFDKDENFFRLN